MRSATNAASLPFSTAARLPSRVLAMRAVSISFSRPSNLSCSILRSISVGGAAEGGVCAPSAGRQLPPLRPSSFRATTWQSRLQNQTLRHRPQHCSLPPLLPHARHEFAAGASNGEFAPGIGEFAPDAVVLGPAASGTRCAALTSAAPFA